MRRSWILIAVGLLVAVLAIGAVACDDDDNGNGDPTATAEMADDAPTEPMDDATEPSGDTGDEPTATAESGDDVGATVVATETGDFGPILTDPEGNTLYIFTVDDPNVTNCLDDCVSLWPPFTTDGEPTAGEGVVGTLGTITRPDDGSSQVTYNEAPLYYFGGDEAPGDTNGQNFGGVWFVVEAE